MKSLANAVGGKTARACDSCVKRRARWYCAADDAFLCQACDGSVHSANPLARRHERVRLKSASSGRACVSPPRAAAATWHQGFTRKARTPRGGKQSQRAVFHDLVPEIGVEDQTESYEEEQLICQVPEMDPMVAEQYRNDAVEAKTCFPSQIRMKFADMNDKDDEDNAESCLNGFFPTDMELAEFAADVETLLGHGLESESYSMNDLGLGDQGFSSCGRSSSSMVPKVEKEEVAVRRGMSEELLCERGDIDVTPFELSFDYESHKRCEEEEDEKEDEKGKVMNVNNGEEESGERSGVSYRIKEEDQKEKEKKKILMLRLNHEEVISTWGGQGSPWTAGEPPEMDFDNDAWPIFMGGNGREAPRARYDGGHCGVRLQGTGGGREARVSRYREKRRTRLFSKKIRYEVRKLNAEKRPRMKGRFVKRASLSALTSSLTLLTK